jgi:hypothetical protein
MWIGDVMRNNKILLTLTSLLMVSTAVVAQSRRLDTTTFVVVGEGMAAGVQNFSLGELGQQGSFPALVARQMGTIFPQPVFQSPGLGNVVGFPPLPVSLPATLQTTVRRPFPPSLFVFNLSVPGFRTADALSRRPVPPLINNGDPKQTLTNFVLGYPQLILENDIPLWTPLEYAVAMRPTLALVELGYYEVLEAAVTGDLSRLPQPGAFRSDYERIVRELRATFAEVVVTTIPDPLDTAYFSDPIAAARLLRVPPFVVLGLYGLDLDDRITVPGLVEIGNQFLARISDVLPSGSWIDAETAAEITAFVNQLNGEIRSLAGQQGAVVCDLNAFFRELKDHGATVGGKHLTAEFLGGLYSLNGYYPGPTGHALIANEVLRTLNQAYGSRFPPVRVEDILEDDGIADYRIADGVETTLEELAEFIEAPRMRQVLLARSRLEAHRLDGREPTTGRRPVGTSRPGGGRP